MGFMLTRAGLPPMQRRGRRPGDRQPAGKSVILGDPLHRIREPDRVARAEQQGRLPVFQEPREHIEITRNDGKTRCLRLKRGEAEALLQGGEREDIGRAE